MVICPEMNWNYIKEVILKKKICQIQHFEADFQVYIYQCVLHIVTNSQKSHKTPHLWVLYINIYLQFRPHVYLSKFCGY